MNQRAVVVDLDGTLMRCNTFSRFTLWLLLRLLACARFGAATRVAATVARRKARRVSHAEAKHGIMEVARRELRTADWARFAASLRGQISKDVIGMVERYKTAPGSGEPMVILATAAPQEYAVAVGKLAGADAVIATQWVPDVEAYRECRVEEKLRRVRQFVENRGVEVVAVLTDHHDDLPLLRHYKARGMLVHPSRETLKCVAASGVTLSPTAQASEAPSRRATP